MQDVSSPGMHRRLSPRERRTRAAPARRAGGPAVPKSQQTWFDKVVRGEIEIASVYEDDQVAEAPWSVAEWAVALRFDNPRATVPVLVLG